jgi:chromosome segregation ATPase
MEILVWVLTSALALVSAAALWFLKRYFKGVDEEAEGVKKKLHAHETKMEKLAEKMEDHSRKLGLDIATFKSSAQDFQQKLSLNIQDLKTFSMDSQTKVNNELNQLERQADKIHVVVDRTLGKAEVFEQKIDKTSGQVDGVTKTLESHAKALRTFAEIVKVQKTQMDNLSKDYATTKTKLSEELVLIRSKKSGEDPK